MKKKFLFLVLLILCVSYVNAAYVTNLPVTVTQADGTTISCYASGDEFYNWLHDENNFTITQNSEGYYCYAIKQGDKVVASQYRVGTVDPVTIGISPGVSISAESKMAIRKRFYENTPDISTAKNYRAPTGPKNIGQLNNLVVYIKFADQTEFPNDTMFYWEMFNKTDDPSYQSLQNYFEQVSYDKLSIPSYFYPLTNSTTIISYTDSHPRDYFMPYHPVTAPNGYNIYGDESAEREQKLLKDAIDYIADMVPRDLNLDYNKDGMVDNIVFIVRGGTTDWSTLLWPHKWALFYEDAYIHGKQIWEYNFQVEEHLNYYQSSVLCHEMFHTLGAPDLYRYNPNSQITPVGEWDVMAHNSYPAQSMSAYMKYKYGGWIDELPEITTQGFYTLNTPWSETNNMYKITSPYSTNEFFLLEYRNKQHAFDAQLPGEGLLIYRVYPEAEGNAYGPPDELYIFRPRGYDMATEGSLEEAHFSEIEGRTEFSDETDPPCFFMYNQPGGIHIRNIGNPEETISFEVLLENFIRADFYSDIREATLGCGINFFGTTINPIDEWYWEFEDGIPATSNEQNPTGIEFSEFGLKTIKLTVSNQYGTYIEEKETYINISDDKSNADFSCIKAASYIGTEMELIDESDLCPFKWTWTFEPNTIEFVKGTNCNSQNPVIIATSLAHYDVTLTVENVNGETTITKENFITTIGRDIQDYVLDFENDITFEDIGVTIVNPDDRLTWELIEINTAEGTNKAAYINSYNYIYIISERDYLILPLLNITDAYEMNFRHAYATKTGNSDTLIVSISTNGGESWDRLAYLYEGDDSNFITAPLHIGNFIPEENEWCGEKNTIPCTSIDLSQYAETQSVLIRFEAVSIWSNNIFIDDISFVRKPIGIDDQPLNQEIKIYPNPSSGVYYINTENIEEKYDAFVYDIVGNLILSNKNNLGNTKVDISNNKSGIYFIKIISNNINKTIKIIKE